MTTEPDDAGEDVQPEPAEAYIIEIDSGESLQASRPEGEIFYYGSERPTLDR